MMKQLSKNDFQLYIYMAVIFLLIGVINLVRGETLDASVWLLLGSAFGSLLIAERRENPRVWQAAALVLTVSGIAVFALELIRAFST